MVLAKSIAIGVHLQSCLEAQIVITFFIEALRLHLPAVQTALPPAAAAKGAAGAAVAAAAAAAAAAAVAAAVAFAACATFASAMSGTQS